MVPNPNIDSVVLNACIVLREKLPSILTRVTIVLSLYCLLLYFYGVEKAYAQQRVETESVRADNERSIFEASVRSEISHVENANRVSQDEDEISETQTSNALELFGQYNESDFIKAFGDYTFREERFNKNTRPTDSRLEGKAGLLVGDKSKRFDAQLSHNSRTLLVDPGKDDISGNRDSRQILSAAITARTVASRANVFSLTGEFTDVDFDAFNINDSARDTFSFRYRRQLNASTAYGLIQSFTDVDFDDSQGGESADYSYRKSALFLNRQLRKANYRISAGQYKTNIDINGDDTAFFGEASAGYKARHLTFSLDLSQTITDTSQGSANIQNLIDQTNLDGRVGLQDQITRKSVLASVNTTSICSRCYLSAYLGLYDNDFSNFQSESSNSQVYGLNASYQFQEKLSARLRITNRAFEYDRQTLNGEYEFLTTRAQLEKTSHRNKLSTAIFIQQVDRSSEELGDYTSRSIGAGIEYRFF